MFEDFVELQRDSGGALQEDDTNLIDSPINWLREEPFAVDRSAYRLAPTLADDQGIEGLSTEPGGGIQHCLCDEDGTIRSRIPDQPGECTGSAHLWRSPRSSLVLSTGPHQEEDNMTTIDSGEPSVHAEEVVAGEHRPNRGSCSIAAITLAVAVAGLAGWIIYDQAISTVDAEVQQLLNDHREAWMTGHVENLRVITTYDYSYDEVVYINDPFEGFKLAFHVPGDFDDAVEDLERGGNTVTGGEVARWRIEQVGDPIVRGDGPSALVAVNENW